MKEQIQNRLPGDHPWQNHIYRYGVNCRQRETDSDQENCGFAGSLSMVTGRPIGRTGVAAAMITAPQAMNSTLLTGKRAVMERCRRDCVTAGRDVCLIRSGEVSVRGM